MLRFPWTGRRVIVTGGRGFLGRHVVEVLHELGAQPVAVGRAEADLREWAPTKALFEAVGAQVVVHCAVVGGGIGWMRHHPVDSGHDNALLNLNALAAAQATGAELFLGASSACAYPRQPRTIPFVEAELWEGYPEPTNGPYALSKRQLMDMGHAYQTQHGLRCAFAVLANLYGPGDDLDPGRAHVVAGLVMRCLADPPQLVVWGTGTPTREHLFVGDAARGLLALAGLSQGGVLNIGTGIETSVLDLAHSIAQACGYAGQITTDPSQPDGQPRKVLNVQRASDLLGWRATTPLADGLARTVEWYRESRP